MRQPTSQKERMNKVANFRELQRQYSSMISNLREKNQRMSVQMQGMIRNGLKVDVQYNPSNYTLSTKNINAQAIKRKRIEEWLRATALSANKKRIRTPDREDEDSEGPMKQCQNIRMVHQHNMSICYQMAALNLIINSNFIKFIINKRIRSWIDLMINESYFLSLKKAADVSDHVGATSAGMSMCPVVPKAVSNEFKRLWGDEMREGGNTFLATKSILIAGGLQDKDFIGIYHNFKMRTMHQVIRLLKDRIMDMTKWAPKVFCIRWKEMQQESRIVQSKDFKGNDSLLMVINAMKDSGFNFQGGHLRLQSGKEQHGVVFLACYGEEENPKGSMTPQSPAPPMAVKLMLLDSNKHAPTPLPNPNAKLWHEVGPNYFQNTNMINMWFTLHGTFHDPILLIPPKGEERRPLTSLSGTSDDPIVI